MFSYIRKLKGKSEPPKTYYDRKRDTRGDRDGSWAFLKIPRFKTCGPCGEGEGRWDGLGE